MTTPNDPWNKQQGVALISTLLIFAIASILAAQLIAQSQADIQRTSWLLDQSQDRQYAIGGEILARIQLKKALQENKALSLLTPQPIYPLTTQAEDAQIEIEFVDLQGQINVNNLMNKDHYSGIVQRYLQDSQAQPEFIDGVKDWLDSDESPSDLGGEDGDYRDLEPSYKSANRALIATSELASITGYNAEWFKENHHVLSTLPPLSSININSASADVLTALATGLDGEQVVNMRANLEGGFESVESFLNTDVTAGIEVDSSLISTQSNYYAIRIRVKQHDRVNTLYSRFFYNHDAQKLQRLDRASGIKFSIESIITEGTEQDDKQPDPIF
jgi:general secretion pathway protein K